MWNCKQGIGADEAQDPYVIVYLVGDSTLMHLLTIDTVVYLLFLRIYSISNVKFYYYFIIIY